MKMTPYYIYHWSGQKDIPSNLHFSFIFNKISRFISSLSSGDIQLFNFDTTGFRLTRTIEAAHSHEAWISAWDNWRDVFYSGGDDGYLLVWDERMEAPASKHR